METKSKYSWLFVKKGKKIFFVSCINKKPEKVIDDINFAFHYEQGRDFSYKISDFNRQSSERIERLFYGKSIDDARPIISAKDFKKIQKDHKTSLELS